MQLTLIRVGQSVKGTFGVLRHEQVPLALTLEEPWRGNQQSISCIPEGTYKCQRVLSPKFGDTFEVNQVPGRTHILFHKGNSLQDTEGCILIGDVFSGPTVASSTRGYFKFMALLAGLNEFELVIVSVP